MDKPNERSSHNKKTPTLGGVAIFISVSITIMLASYFMQEEIALSYLFPVLTALLILFFLGIQDDLLSISPIKKLVGQIMAAIVVASLTNYRINDLEGVLGIYELPYMISFLFTVFTYVLIINSFNLIDGVDGLAGSFAIIVSILFGIYFILNNSYFMAMISCSLIGALSSFLKFNLSKKNKIFMGDTGSMIVGFLLAFQAITFIQINQTSVSFNIENAVVITLAILSFPLIDTFRVFTIRILNKKSPFSADKNHIHHKLLELGFSHKQIALTIASYTVYITCFIYNLRFLNTSNLLIILGLATLMAFYPIYSSMFERVKIKSLKNTK